MKFTLGWLKEHLDTQAPLDDILFALTDLGLEVEGVEDPSAPLAPFTICRVIEAVQHPNADRLRLCRVETWPEGADKPSQEVQVVCGAPNARTGLIGVFAPLGTLVPGTGVSLKAGVIRGIESNGMLCSERELMLSEDHDGIIELPADAPLGARFIDYRGGADPVIEIKITPNRPDALGVRGIARDLAARGIGRLIDLPVAPVAGRFVSPIRVTLNADVADRACPLFLGRYVRGVRNGPSPEWLQARLKAIGLRPISALVDVTNFLTYDRNRPLHVFDAAKVTGDIEVRLARPGESLLALDGKDYVFAGGETLIADAAGPEAIGGVIGGMPSGCTPETTDVFIEAALFDPIATAVTGRRHKINSDARYRFERGIDPAFVRDGIELATAMILELCGGEPSEIVVAGKAPDTARSYLLDPGRVVSLVGMEIARDEQIAILERLGFAVTETGGALMASVPSWRPDVLGEADLVEEIVRVASLTGLKGAPLGRPEPGVARPVLTARQKREAAMRRQAAALGYNECITYSFIEQKMAALFGGGTDSVMLANPIASDMSHLRPSLLPGLLAAAARNQARGAADLRLFELGPVFSGGEPDDMQIALTAILVGHSAARDSHSTRRPFDIYDIKTDAEALLAATGVAVERLTVSRTAPAWFHPGRSAVLSLGPKNLLAMFGELHPKVLREADVKGPAMALVLFAQAIPFAKTRNLARPPLVVSEFQAVERDFAFEVDDTVEAAAILRAAQSSDKELIENVSVFDVFGGAKAEAQLGEGRKSVAITIRLQPRQATLTEADITAVGARVIAAVSKATGAVLRG